MATHTWFGLDAIRVGERSACLQAIEASKPSDAMCQPDRERTHSTTGAKHQFGSRAVGTLRADQLKC